MRLLSKVGSWFGYGIFKDREVREWQQEYFSQLGESLAPSFVEDDGGDLTPQHQHHHPHPQPPTPPQQAVVADLQEGGGMPNNNANNSNTNNNENIIAGAPNEPTALATLNNRGAFCVIPIFTPPKGRDPISHEARAHLHPVVNMELDGWKLTTIDVMCNVMVFELRTRQLLFTLGSDLSTPVVGKRWVQSQLQQSAMLQKYAVWGNGTLLVTPLPLVGGSLVVNFTGHYQKPPSSSSSQPLTASSSTSPSSITTSFTTRNGARGSPSSSLSFHHVMGEDPPQDHVAFTQSNSGTASQAVAAAAAGGGASSMMGLSLGARSSLSRRAGAAMVRRLTTLFFDYSPDDTAPPWFGLGGFIERPKKADSASCLERNDRFLARALKERKDTEKRAPPSHTARNSVPVGVPHAARRVSVAAAAGAATSGAAAAEPQWNPLAPDDPQPSEQQPSPSAAAAAEGVVDSATATTTTDEEAADAADSVAAPAQLNPANPLHLPAAQMEEEEVLPDSVSGAPAVSLLGSRPHSSDSDDPQQLLVAPHALDDPTVRGLLQRRVFIQQYPIAWRFYRAMDHKVSAFCYLLLVLLISLRLDRILMTPALVFVALTWISAFNYLIRYQLFVAWPLIALMEMPKAEIVCAMLLFTGVPLLAALKIDTDWFEEVSWLFVVAAPTALCLLPLTIMDVARYRLEIKLAEYQFQFSSKNHKKQWIGVWLLVVAAFLLMVFLCMYFDDPMKRHFVRLDCAQTSTIRAWGSAVSVASFAISDFVSIYCVMLPLWITLFVLLIMASPPAMPPTPGASLCAERVKLVARHLLIYIGFIVVLVLPAVGFGNYYHHFYQCSTALYVPGPRNRTTIAPVTTTTSSSGGSMMAMLGRPMRRSGAMIQEEAATNNKQRRDTVSNDDAHPPSSSRPPPPPPLVSSSSSSSSPAAASTAVTHPRWTVAYNASSSSRSRRPPPRHTTQRVQDDDTDDNHAAGHDEPLPRDEQRQLGVVAMTDMTMHGAGSVPCGDDRFAMWLIMMPVWLSLLIWLGFHAGQGLRALCVVRVPRMMDDETL